MNLLANPFNYTNMKKLFFLLTLIATLISCQKTKDDLAEDLIKKSIRLMNNAGKEATIVSYGPLMPAQLEFEETEKGVLLKDEIDKINKEVSEDLKFLKQWAGVANIETDLDKVQSKIKLARQLEDSLQTESSHFTYDTSMVMKPVVIKRKEGGTLITDTAYYFFDKTVTQIIGIKGKEKGTYQYFDFKTKYQR